MRFLVVYEGDTVETATIEAMSDAAALLEVVQAYLTVHAPLERLRRCQACDTFFVVRHGKQQYCTRACVNRVSTRRWRETTEHREAEQRRARQRYAARTGPPCPPP